MGPGTQIFGLGLISNSSSEEYTTDKLRSIKKKERGRKEEGRKINKEGDKEGGKGRGKEQKRKKKELLLFSKAVHFQSG